MWKGGCDDSAYSQRIPSADSPPMQSRLQTCQISENFLLHGGTQGIAALPSMSSAITFAAVLRRSFSGARLLRTTASSSSSAPWSPTGRPVTANIGTRIGAPMLPAFGSSLFAKPAGFRGMCSDSPLCDFDPVVGKYVAQHVASPCPCESSVALKKPGERGGIELCLHRGEFRTIFPDL